MRARTRVLAITTAMAVLTSLFAGSSALAVDLETDGPFEVRSEFTGNYGVVFADQGLYPDVEGGSLTVDVPATATDVVATYLWWSGRIRNSFGTPPDSGDDTVDITVGGGAVQTITATDRFWADEGHTFAIYNYWYDLTGQIGTGSTEVTLDDFYLQNDVDDGNRHFGFGVAVVYEDPALPEQTVVIRDGQDRGYFDWPPPAGPDSAVHCQPVPFSLVDQTIQVTANITGVDSNEGLLRAQTLWWLAGTGEQPAGDDSDVSGIKDGTPIVNPVFPGPVDEDPYGFVFYTFDAVAPAGSEWLCVQLESVDDGTVGATTGMGSLMFGIPTVYRVGNLVWADTNLNGTADDGEPGIAGVTLELYDSGGALLATTESDADGKYAFEGVPPGFYTVVIPAGQAGAGGPLENLTSTPNTVEDPDTDLDNDDNGILADGVVTSSTITLGDPDLVGEASSEPTDEILRSDDPTDDDPDDTIYEDVRSNFSLDFGFQPTGVEEQGQSVGNQVWLDEDADGIKDADEPGIQGVVVWLLDEDGNFIEETVTDGDGLYLFDELPAGDYLVKIADENFEEGGALEETDPTPVQEADPNTDIDGDSNGIVVDDMVMSGTVTLGDGEPLGEDPNNDPATPDGDSNLTVDFGFVSPEPPEDAVSVGNLVWWDLDDDGLVDEGEPSFAGVTVNLWSTDADGDPVAIVETTVTDADGHYGFLVDPGTYIVQIPPEMFADGAPLDGFVSSTPTFDPTSGVDDDDNGADVTDLGILTAPFPVEMGEAPTGEADDDPFDVADEDSDLTIDLGVTQVLAGIGDYVWFDEIVNNQQDPGEPPVPGVVVRIYNDEGFLVDETVTDENGYYEFIVPPGDYWLEFDWDPTTPIDVDPELFDPEAPLALVIANVGPPDLDSDGFPVKSDSTIARTEMTTLDPGEFDPTWDLGLVRPPVEQEEECDPETEECDDLPDTGHDADEQAGYALMLMGLGGLLVVAAGERTRRQAI